MERSIRCFALALLVGTVPAAVAGTAADRVDLRTQAHAVAVPESYGPALEFDRLDANASGEIDRREARGDRRIHHSFRQVDASRDGGIDAAEFAAFEPSERMTMNDTPDTSFTRMRDRDRR